MDHLVIKMNCSEKATSTATLNIYVGLALIFILSCLSLGCSKKKPAQVLIKERCKQEILKQPLRRIERRFFKDNKTRNILSFKDLYSGTINEVSSSATAAVYVHTWGFKDEKGDAVRLLRSSNTRASLVGSNLVTIKFRCRVVWNLFKSEVNDVQIKAYSSDLRDLQ